MPNTTKIKTMIILGVTGQLSTGKSTVSAILAKLGAAVINADLLAHRGMRAGGACFKKVVRLFGAGILSKGQIDHKKLAQIVFTDLIKLKKLERIIHPFVMKATWAEIQVFKKAGKKVVVLDVPLLFESGMDRLTDLNVVVKTNAKVQMERVLIQGRLSRAEAKRRISCQMTMAEKALRADIVVNNNGTLKATEKQVNDIWDMIKRRYF